LTFGVKHLELLFLLRRQLQPIVQRGSQGRGGLLLGTGGSGFPNAARWHPHARAIIASNRCNENALILDLHLTTALFGCKTAITAVRREPERHKSTLVRRFRRFAPI
jgi:hypothetical protein